MVEYAVKDIMDQLFVTLRNKDAEDAASFPPVRQLFNKCKILYRFSILCQDPAARQDFLQELRTTVDRHLTEVNCQLIVRQITLTSFLFQFQLFSTRNTLDRIQDQITNIKAHAWDPKRNIPYWCVHSRQVCNTCIF